MARRQWFSSLLQRARGRVTRIFSRHSPPVILQTCNAECGLACLAMIASHHGRDVDLKSLRDMFGAQRFGMTLESLLKAADRLNFSSRLFRIEPRDLKWINKPAILHWNFSHFVVLTRTSKTKIFIHDPARGAVAHSYAEADSCFTGVAAQLSPTLQFARSSDTRRIRLTSMFKTVSDQKPRIGLLILFALLSQVFALIAPYYFQLIVDNVIQMRSILFLYYIATIFLCLGFAEWVTETGRMNLNAQLGALLNANFSTSIFRHMLRLPIEFFESRDSSNLAAKIESMTEIREIFTKELPRILVSAVMFTTTLVVLCSYSVLLTGLVTFVLAMYVCFRLITYSQYRLHFENTFVKRAQAAAYFLDTVRSIVSVKAQNAEAFRTGDWRQHVAETTKSQYFTDVSLEKLRLARDRSTQLENIFSLFLAAHFMMSSQMTIGMVMAYFMYKRLYWDSGQTIIDVIFKLRLARIHLDRLSDILLEKQEPAYQAGFVESNYVDLGAPTIVAKDLQYTFPQSQSGLFSPLNFEIKMGDRVAVTGHSGAGKTTLLYILLGLKAGYQGTIKISGHELSSIPRDLWLTRVAVVLQGQQLFSGTIRENICFGSIGIDEARMRQAAQEACIQQRINLLPMRYDTQMGEFSQLLSAGEVQRILIARALYRGAPLLILDEGTANLDVDTELNVLANLRKLNISVIHATHRTEVLKDATQIINLAAMQPRAMGPTFGTIGSRNPGCALQMD